MANQLSKKKSAAAADYACPKSSERILAAAIHAAEDLGDSALLLELAIELESGDLTQEQWELVATAAIHDCNLPALARAGKEIDFGNSRPNRFAVHEDSLVSAEDGWLAAAITSNVEIFEYLRAAGCPTQIEDSDSLLHVACQFNADPAVFDAVLAISDVNAVDAQGRTALMWMALSDATQNVQALLRAGADANLLDDEKRSALFYALHLDHRMPKHIRDFVVDVARAFNPSAISGDGMTAIAFAASDSRWGMVDVLCSVWGLKAAEEAALAAMKTLMPHAAKLLAASQEKREMQEAMLQSASAEPLSATADENSVKEAVKTSRASKKTKTKGARRV